MHQIVLASTSPFRKQLFEKLHCPFVCAKPNINESPLDNETAERLVHRLSIEKAKECAKNFKNALIIGSDQVCVNNGEILGKPGNFENAFQQLKAASTKKITFYTGLTLLNTQTQKTQSLVETFIVHFRELSDEMIKNYLHEEQPYQCAGSFKSEGYGITLFQRLEGRDPNTLIGLPLISLITMLENEGVKIL